MTSNFFFDFFLLTFCFCCKSIELSLLFASRLRLHVVFLMVTTVGDSRSLLLHKISCSTLSSTVWCSGRGWRWSVALSPPQRRWEMLLKMEYSLDFILPSVDASRLAKEFLFFFWLVCLSCLPPPLWRCLTSIPLYTTLTAAYCKERIANASLIKGRDVKNGFLNSLPTCP